MPTPVIVGAVRTAIGRSFKGTLVNTPPETLITAVLPEVVRRSGVDPTAFDDLIFAESHYGEDDVVDVGGVHTGPADHLGQHRGDQGFGRGIDQRPLEGTADRRPGCTDNDGCGHVFYLGLRLR